MAMITVSQRTYKFLFIPDLLFSYKLDAIFAVYEPEISVEPERRTDLAVFKLQQINMESIVND